MWVASKGKKQLDKKFIPYLMATIVDTMIEEEVCLNLREDKDCLVISIDRNADVIDCKEFFEAFYHLATGSIMIQIQEFQRIKQRQRCT